LTAAESGQRLDAFLAQAAEGMTRSAIQKRMEAGGVLHKGQPVKKNEKTQAGEAYTLLLPDPEPVDIQPENIPLDIVYEDGDVVVVNKPVGMVVHPAPGHYTGTLVNALLYYCGDSLSGINGEIRPGIVHRIDRDTSGLLIVAKNDGAHQALAEQLKDHSLARTYEAIVIGNLREDRGTVDAPIGRHPVDRKKMCVDPRNGRPAVTHWEVIARYPGCTHVRCKLETGRTHQIRVHMASIGHPLLGDQVYGSKKPYPGLAGQCLHAKELTFRHPTTGTPVTLTCPLPPWFQQILDKLERGGDYKRERGSLYTAEKRRYNNRRSDYYIRF
jgi:23S rRNA pseudouridine1911/1915/1917 synthase